MGENQEVVHGQLSLVNVEQDNTQYKFPIETYTGLDAANAERIKKFEAETKAMLTRNVQEPPSNQSSRLSLDGHTNRLKELHLTGSESSLGSLARSTAITGHQILSSVTTPVPEVNPLDGGILLEEPYPTDAYDQYPCEDYLSYTLPSSAQAAPLKNIPNELLTAFDTNKVAKRGTLQRLKFRNRTGDSSPDSDPRGSDNDTEEQTEDADSLLGKLSASFDQKMRFLLDPNYQGEEEAGNLSNIHEQVILEAGTKKELDDVKNSLLKATKKVDLKRSARVNRNSEPETRKSGRQEPVLRPVNCQKALKRSDSLTKKRKD